MSLALHFNANGLMEKEGANEGEKRMSEWQR